MGEPRPGERLPAAKCSGSCILTAPSRLPHGPSLPYTGIPSPPTCPVAFRAGKVHPPGFAGPGSGYWLVLLRIPSTYMRAVRWGDRPNPFFFFFFCGTLVVVSTYFLRT
ncbi:hypothetical protein BO71DRAFT_10784 [Aspergillus ellipticus CBS 707.79]|uniref:Uncharacterized protein n=1 Tax=Aspergillus ellipticus CBS 707.79 TaxID=1448320 RepID=A0A319DNU4_9EURO|nr:hypothetical protein BO71DRAFT_10784 [Aspergillus ellipticus CBS 707.79]